MRRSDGFTLLEVMVALAIAIPALIVLYREGGVALALTGSAQTYQNAISRAESHLAAIDAGALTAGDREGDDGGGFRWRVRIMPADTLPPGRNTPAKGATLYDVAVAISWQAGDGTRTFSLATRRIGPAAEASP